jgi:hypothetical protein
MAAGGKALTARRTFARAGGLNVVHYNQNITPAAEPPQREGCCIPAVLAPCHHGAMLALSLTFCAASSCQRASLPQPFLLLPDDQPLSLQNRVVQHGYRVPSFGAREARPYTVVQTLPHILQVSCAMGSSGSRWWLWWIPMLSTAATSLYCRCFGWPANACEY